MKHYLQLIDANSVEWQDFNQFYVISVNTERQILVHFVRSRNSQERGIRLSRVLLDEAALGVSPDTVWRDWDLAKARLYREKRHGET